MYNSTNIFTFDCKLELPAEVGDLKVEALQITYGIRKIGAVEVQGHPDKGDAIVVEAAPVAEYYAIAGKIQKYVNTVTRETTDCTLSLTYNSTEGSESLNLQLLLAGASVAISATGSLSLSVSLLGEDALMSGWSPSTLYTSDHRIKGTGDGQTKGITGRGVGDITAAIIEALEIDRTRAISISTTASKDPGLALAVKEYNNLKAYAEMVKTFLKRNADRTELQGYFSWPEPAKTALIEAIVPLIKGSKDGMSLLLAENGLSYFFGVNYISNLSSGADETSMLIRAVDVFDEDPKTVDLPLLTGSVRISASDVVPLTGVKCQLPAGLIVGDGQTKGSALSSFRYFPKSAADKQAPRIATINPPSYLLHMTVPGSKAKDPPDPVVPDPETGKDGSKTATKEVNNRVKNLADLVDDWLKVHYIMMSLQGCIGSVAVPLDLSWEAGKMYTVQGPDQQPLFTGLLQTVVHSINVRPENGSAITNLNFAFVTGNGYELQLD